MSLRSIAVGVIIILFLYLLYRYFYENSSLSVLSDARNMQIIKASTLPQNSNSGNYAYSIWFYVDDWNYRYGEPKVIFGRLDENKDHSPSVVFDAMQNNLNISVATYGTKKSNKSKIHKCNVPNIPLQKWVNLVISLYGRSLDVYIDGKLVRTCVLPGVAKVNRDSPVFITPKNGFSGYTSNFQYFDTALNPQEAYNIYRNGYGGSSLGNLFNKYRVRVTFLENNTAQGSFEI